MIVLISLQLKLFYNDYSFNSAKFLSIYLTNKLKLLPYDYFVFPIVDFITFADQIYIEIKSTNML